jgi:hypothetical protein
MKGKKYVSIFQKADSHFSKSDRMIEDEPD